MIKNLVRKKEVPAAQKREAIIFHGHIFKNAGSTFDWALERNFGNSFVDHRDDTDMRRGGSAYLKKFVDDNPGMTALSSHHLCMPLPCIQNTQLLFCTLLRHPIERVRSVYNFERRQRSNTPGAIHAKKYSFGEYVKWRMNEHVNPTIRDFQVFFCSGSKVRQNDVAALLGGLGKASLLGVVDRYDESMVYFEHRLKEYFPEIDLAYIRQNSSPLALDGQSQSGVQEKADAVLEELGPNLAGILMENNVADLAFYELVNRRLDERLKKIRNLTRKLQDFRNRCASLKQPD